MPELFKSRRSIRKFTDKAPEKEKLDAMLKAADVTLYEAHPICPGKYLVVVGGQVGAVEESLQAGVRIGREAVSDHMILPNVHQDVFSALSI